MYLRYGNRASQTDAGGFTLYLGGLWEREVQTGTTRSRYAFNGQVIAQRETTGGVATLNVR